MHYQKILKIIEAEQFTGTKLSWDKIMSMGNIKWKPGPINSDTWILQTIEGDEIINKDDYVIKLDEDSFYSLNNKIFNQMYEPHLPFYRPNPHL